jgi:hypothetical protein
MKFKGMKYPALISPTHVPELNKIEISDKGVVIGSAVTLTRIMTVFKDLIKDLPEYKTRTLKATVEQLRYAYAQYFRETFFSAFLCLQQSNKHTSAMSLNNR